MQVSIRGVVVGAGVGGEGFDDSRSGRGDGGPDGGLPDGGAVEDPESSLEVAPVVRGRGAAGEACANSVGPTFAISHHVIVTFASGPDDIPSPALAAAWERLGILPSERVPLWAAHWILAGHDGEHLINLAGLHGDDPHDAHDALPGALHDCGVSWPESDVAAATVAFTHLARMHLAGQAGALWVAEKVEEVVLHSGYCKGVMALPLGHVYGVTDAWGAGWGGTNEQLAASVTAACEEQLAASRSTP